MKSIGFIGAGTVGTALAFRLKEQGYQVSAVASRTLASAERLAGMVGDCQVFVKAQEVANAADVVFITTPDDVISQIACDVRWKAGQSVIHCSGAASTDILSPARELGAQVGAMHPLQTLASIEHAIENIPGSSFALEAEEPLLSYMKDMVNALKGWWLVLKPGDKVLYHAAAVIACNYLVTLVKLATDLWKTFGVDTKEATQALLPLLQGAVNNIGSVGLPNCLTGPIARGDLGTIAKHLSALQSNVPAILPVYKELGRQTVPIALAKGKVDEAKARDMLELLS